MVNGQAHSSPLRRSNPQFALFKNMRLYDYVISHNYSTKHSLKISFIEQIALWTFFSKPESVILFTLTNTTPSSSTCNLETCIPTPTLGVQAIDILIPTPTHCVQRTHFPVSTLVTGFEMTSILTPALF